MAIIRAACTSSDGYDVTIGQGLSYGALAARVKKPCRVVIVSDDHVFPLYGASAMDSFREHGFQVSSYVFPHGEASKNLSTVEGLLGFLAGENITRGDLLAALGGGVVGDLTGFTAAVYLRGVNFIQLPTTVLAAVDSSVGGKTGVDLAAGKNLAGAFYRPLAVFCDVNTFNTLPANIYADGMAEVIKHGMIADAEMLGRLEERAQSGTSANEAAPNVIPTGEHAAMDIIKRNVEIKAGIVAQDEFDVGVRRLLNFGHTVGHAIEALSGYGVSHGSAVAAGMAVITRAGVKMGLTEEGCYRTLVNVLEKYGLPTACAFNAKEITGVALKDKKRMGETIALVMVSEVGKARIMDIPVNELERVVEMGLR